MEIIKLTAQNFDEIVTKSDKPVLIDFFATWCGPCKMLSPVVDEVAEEVDDVVFCKIDVDEEGELANRFNVMSVPTLVLLENGEVENSSVGFIPKEELLEFIGK